jgi:hypothetical protein
MQPLASLSFRGQVQRLRRLFRRLCRHRSLLLEQLRYLDTFIAAREALGGGGGPAQQRLRRGLEELAGAALMIGRPLDEAS